MVIILSRCDKNSLFKQICIRKAFKWEYQRFRLLQTIKRFYLKHILWHKVESQLSSINLNLETALHRRNVRKHSNDTHQSRSYRRRATSQPAARFLIYKSYKSLFQSFIFRNRISSDHVQVIPINFEDNESKAFCKKVTPQSSVSRIMISSTQTQSISKPIIPDKPKNIQLIKKKLEDIKSANICPSSEITLRTSVLRKSDKLKNNPVKYYWHYVCKFTN